MRQFDLAHREAVDESAEWRSRFDEEMERVAECMKELNEVEDNICKFAKKGLTPPQIGVILRDSHGIAQVRSVTGSKILRILKAIDLKLVCNDLVIVVKTSFASTLLLLCS